MDGRKHAIATERNREPILKVLSEVLPSTGTVLEIASGTGEHAAYFAPRLKPRKWIPSDINPSLHESIIAWIRHSPSENLYQPLKIDASQPVWKVETQELLEISDIVAMVNINMIHISPWSACLGLMAAAGRILPPGGILYLYGPYKQGGEHTAPSNAAFSEYLQEQNPEWGVRNLEDVLEIAKTNNLFLQKTYPMPANNLSVVFKKVKG
ncbi:MAG: class I SAM-dependent methyltransferase [Rivularia sp. ALOHA_DT_140]|nr:class I SAM-dependent methyltransferase [Rivularia sp. ALOHA_DT_140]